MLGMLASIGIEKGKPFAPDAERAKVLTEGVREAAAYMQDGFMNRAFDPFWPDRQWMATKPENNFGYSFYGDGQARLRPPRRGLRVLGHLGAEATDRSRQAAGVVLPEELPRQVRRHCSAATGSIACAFPPIRPRATSGRSSPTSSGPTPSSTTRRTAWACPRTTRSKMAVNEDGSVDVYIGPKAPKGLENNWIPTAGKDFWLIARFYGPQQRAVRQDVDDARRRGSEVGESELAIAGRQGSGRDLAHGSPEAKMMAFTRSRVTLRAACDPRAPRARREEDGERCAAVGAVPPRRRERPSGRRAGRLRRARRAVVPRQGVAESDAACGVMTRTP